MTDPIILNQPIGGVVDTPSAAETNTPTPDAPATTPVAPIPVTTDVPVNIPLDANYDNLVQKIADNKAENELLTKQLAVNVAKGQALQSAKDAADALRSNLGNLFSELETALNGIN